ncbi:MAG: hypothetical protein M1818_005695 [Claussenomyces sp. TS43310]|nr:MAG: hypothetical protein M1818_005695 [Claussenomyces sp. TS43310]
MEESNPDLETFRQQWRAEVSARSKAGDSRESSNLALSQNPRISHKQDGSSKPLSSRAVVEDEDQDEDEGEDQDFDGGRTTETHTNSMGETITSVPELVDVEGHVRTGRSHEPRSALEHYEKAVEREAQGSLGDSLNHYRKAFRMDDRVDLKYKNKHFPPPAPLSSKHAVSDTSNNTATTTTSLAQHARSQLLQSVNELIAGFSGLKIEPVPPEIEGTPARPCPISSLPEEILTHILMEVAINDVAEFARLAQVCKRLAYLVATEESIWRRVCVGSEVGFGSMHYRWQTEISGGPILGDNFDLPSEEVTDSALAGGILSTEVLLRKVYLSSWHHMFRQRPRIRYNGCYISTVNYIRPGQASVNQLTWNSPVHIVTYYRYLRFFRDGTVISLLTTTEPAEIVHYLTKDHHKTHRNGEGAHLPSAVMQTALRGRWHLSCAADIPGADLKDAESDVYVETEGVGEKYIYRMELSLRSAGKGARNNKLVWKGFWNYNKLTDDWGEFGLRNDKAFFWSRVKSYGLG